MSRARWWMVGLGAVVLVVAAAALFASPAPDGLESVAAELGFASQAESTSTEILPGYRVPGIDDEGISKIIAGVVGIVLLFIAMVLLGRLMSRRDRSAR